MSRKTFKGGVHPSDKKELAKEFEIVEFTAPEEVAIPIQQHIGAPSRPCVQVGDTVKMGQVIVHDIIGTGADLIAGDELSI